MAGRGAAGRSPHLRLQVYYKADNDRGMLVAKVLEDVHGCLRGRSLTRDELLEGLVRHFPVFPRAQLDDAIAAVLRV